MKKMIIYPMLMAAMVFCALSSFAQPGESKGWPSKERTDFIRECIKTATPNLGPDSARYYCWCMQEKVEKKYPTIELAGKITDEDISSPAWQKDIKDCNGGGTWPSKDRTDFIRECSTAATAQVGAEKAAIYCECMLFKMEKKYPNPNDAGEITEEKLKSPEFQKMMQACLNF